MADKRNRTGLYIFFIWAMVSASLTGCGRDVMPPDSAEQTVEIESAEEEARTEEETIPAEGEADMAVSPKDGEERQEENLGSIEPELPATGTQLSDFAAEGWEIMDSVELDFNQDGIVDYVGVQEVPPNKEKDEWWDEFGLRVLFAIASEGKGQYRLDFQDVNLILTRTEGDFGGLEGSGTSFTTHASGGGKDGWSESYTYTYRDGTWYLTASEECSGYAQNVDDYQKDDWDSGVRTCKTRGRTGNGPWETIHDPGVYELEYTMRLDEPLTLYQASRRCRFAQDRITDWEVRNIVFAEGIELPEDRIRKPKGEYYDSGCMDEKYALYTFLDEESEKDYLALYSWQDRSLTVLSAEENLLNGYEMMKAIGIYQDKVYYSTAIIDRIRYQATYEGEMRIIETRDVIGQKVVRMNLDGTEKETIFTYMYPGTEQPVLEKAPPYLSIGNTQISGGEIVLGVYIGIGEDYDLYYRMNVDGSELREMGKVSHDFPWEEECGPVLVPLSVEEVIEWVFYAEGCYLYYNGKLYGYLAEDGEEIAPCIYSEATPFSEGLACVCLDGKYGYIDKNGEIALPFIYDQASPFREGLAYFSRGEEYGLMDREGAVVLRLEDCDSISSFREGLAYFCRDGLYGYMDQSGRVAIAPVYDDAGYFYDGLASVRKGGFFGLIDKDGREVLAPQYSSIRREETYIIAEREGTYYCIDGERREFSLGAWDSVREEQGMLLVCRNDLYGLMDGDGKRILEPIYKYIVPIAGKELAIVYNDNGEAGVLDYTGQVRVPFIYSRIYADGGGGLCVTDKDTGKEGYLDGEDFSVKIPIVYDSLRYFTGGRAVAALHGKYGLLRDDGTMELPAVYDGIQLFSDGSLAVWTGETVQLTDRWGNLILTGEYSAIQELGNVYETEERSGNSGIRKDYWDRQGQKIVYGYWRRYETVEGVKDTYILRDADGNNILLKAGEEDGQSTEKEFLTNWITPETGPFAEYLKNGAIAVSHAYVEGYMDRFEDLRKEGWCFSKLYRIEGQDVLYFYAEPWKRINIECSSALFIVRDGQVEQLIDGHTGSGTLKGDEVRFLYDSQEDAWKVGTMGSWGGFGGYAYGGEVYSLRGGRAVPEISFMSYNQTTGNYSDDELLENAELFYDHEDNPYTRETILEAGYVREYLIEDQRVTVEEFHALEERYQYQYYLEPTW